MNRQKSISAKTNSNAPSRDTPKQNSKGMRNASIIDGQLIEGGATFHQDSLVDFKIVFYIFVAEKSSTESDASTSNTVTLVETITTPTSEYREQIKLPTNWRCANRISINFIFAYKYLYSQQSRRTNQIPKVMTMPCLANLMHKSTTVSRCGIVKLTRTE